MRLDAHLRNFWLCSSLRFEPGNFFPQPLRNGLLELFLRAAPVKRIKRVAPFIQWNEAARNCFEFRAKRNQLHKHAVQAWLRRLAGIEIQAGGRVLKDELRAPLGACRMPVAAVLNEFQLGLEHS